MGITPYQKLLHLHGHAVAGKALKNCMPASKMRWFSTKEKLSDVVYYTFVWCETTEGEGFWRNICKQAIRKVL